MSGGGATFHFPGAGPSASVSSVSRAAVPDSEDRKQPLYLAGHHGQRQGERERGRGAIAPPAHVQPIALTTTRAGNIGHVTRPIQWKKLQTHNPVPGSITSGYPVHSLALASPSLPPRLAYTQAAQLQVAQQLAAQQAAVQAAAGGPPTTRSESALIRGLSSYGTFSGTTPAPSTAEKSEETGGRRNC